MKLAITRHVFLPLFASALAFTGPAALANNEVPPVNCADDVLGQINNLSRQADPLGFNLGAGINDIELDKHIQSIARIPGEGTPRFFFSKNGNPWIIPDVYEDGLLALVEMGSRNDTGERLRSNRLRLRTDIQASIPTSTDRIVEKFPFVGWAGGLPGYHHPGGIDIAGNIMTVGLFGSLHGESTGLILVLDIADPFNPVEITRIPMPHDVHATTITPYQNGWLLLSLGGPDSNANVQVHFSHDQVLAPGSTFEYIDEWHRDELNDPNIIGDWWHTSADGADGFQSFNLVPQCDGRTYLVGSNITWPFVGDNMLTVFEVFFDIHSTRNLSLAGTIRRELSCSNASTDTVCNFAAGVGVHVTPNKEILVYATEHGSDGPGRSVRMAEFRDGDHAQHDGSANAPVANSGGYYEVGTDQVVMLSGANSLGAPTGPWFDLHEHANFGGRSLPHDLQDAAFEDWFELDRHQSFHDLTSSVRFRAPVGCDLVMYEGWFGNGDSITLPGTGMWRRWPICTTRVGATACARPNWKAIARRSRTLGI